MNIVLMLTIAVFLLSLALLIAILISTLLYLTSNKLKSRNASLSEALDGTHAIGRGMLKQIEELKSRQTNNENAEFAQLISDLITGRGLIEVRRIDPNNVFLKSVKDMGGR